MPKKILKVSNIYISLCLACKIACGILEVVSVRTGNTIFSTFTDFLFSSNFGSSDSIKSFERHIYDSVYPYLSMNNLLYGLFWFWKKKKFDRNCIDAVYSRTSRSLILTTIMWLVLCALNIIDMTFFLLSWRHIKAMILTYNYLENLANGKQYVRINGTNSALLILTQWVAKGSILGPLLFLTFISHLPSAMLISSLIIPTFRLVSTFPWKHKHFNLPSTEHWQSTRNHIGD